MVVDKTSLIEVQPRNSWKSITVVQRWRAGDKSYPYWVTTFADKTDPSGTDPVGALFIQDDLVDRFFTYKAGGPTPPEQTSVIQVAASWGYGQKRDGTNRWLVFQDNTRSMYQTSFGKAVAANPGCLPATVSTEATGPVDGLVYL